MASIIDRDDLLTMTEAARRLPGRPHRSTLWRWARKGVLAADGRRVRLNVVRLGRWVLIAPEDVDAFSEALSAGDTEHSPAPRRPGASSRRSSRAAQAEAEADALGL